MSAGVGGVGVAVEPAGEEPSPQPPGRRFPWTRAVVVVAVLGVGLAAAHVWYQGGTRLDTGSAGLGVHPVAVGSPVSIGVDLFTRSGPSVLVEKATARHSAGVEVRFAIIHTGAGILGVGIADGTVPGSTPLGAHGIRVAQPELSGGATWLVVTVTATSPGSWSVDHIRITYRSWWRTRTVTSGYSIRGTAPPRIDGPRG